MRIDSGNLRSAFSTVNSLLDLATMFVAAARAMPVSTARNPDAVDTNVGHDKASLMPFGKGIVSQALPFPTQLRV